MDNRIYVIYIRTNRRVKWKYADYCGRWAGVSFEYRIENRATDEVITGFINWE